MGALRKPVEEPTYDTEIYVLPFDRARPATVETTVEISLWDRFMGNETVDQVLFVLKGFLVAGLLGFALFAGTVAYQEKTDAGIDLIPGFSASGAVSAVRVNVFGGTQTSRF